MNRLFIRRLATTTGPIINARGETVPPVPPKPRPDPKSERLAVKLPPLQRAPGQEPPPPPPRPARLVVTKDAAAPLLRFDGVVVGNNRPLDVTISAKDRILVLGSAIAPKQKVVDMLLADKVPTALLKDIAGNISRWESIDQRVTRVLTAPQGATVRSHAGSVVGKVPSNSEMRDLLELLGIDEWFEQSERLYPGVSLDCDFGALPAGPQATLLKVWAPILLQHSKSEYKDKNFYVIKPEAFINMQEEDIMETLGKLAPGTGWIRVAAEAYGETWADGIEHSARCGRGSRRLDETIFVFWRDRLLIEPAIRPPE